MLKYCFIKDKETGLVQLGAGCPDEFYSSIGMVKRDVKQSDIDNEWYLTEKCPMKTDEQKAKEEAERLAKSNMTKLDFVNALESYGVNYYEHILPLLNSNLEAKKQWDLCERVYRFNTLLDELAKGFGITPNQLDKIFGGQ
jgi:hypothetical protein